MAVRAVLLVILLATGAASTAVTTAPAASGSCKVPKLTGIKTAAARKALTKAGCPSSALRTTTKCATAAKIGLVLDQKPSPRTVLKKGRRVDVHVGIACAPPPTPPVTPPVPPVDLVGDWTGTYSGLLAGDAGCPDIPISGSVAVSISGSGPQYTLSFVLENGDVITNGAECKELGRTDSSGDVTATATGGTLTATGFKATLSAGTLAGSFMTASGKFSFSVTHAS